MEDRVRRWPGHVPLSRALSKLGIASRAEATRLVLDGLVAVDGRVVRNPEATVVPERARFTIGGKPATRAEWRLVLLNKPRGVVTTRRDPQGRPTVFDLVSGVEGHLVAVGRLDLATSGLLLMTTDTRLADWLTDPRNRVPRVYTVTVRGEFGDEAAALLTQGIDLDGERLAADEVTVRKRSRRETHLVVTLREGRNREIRRLFDALGHEVTRLRRVAFGGLELGTLLPGRWRDVGREELRQVLPASCDPSTGSGSPRAKSRGDLAKQGSCEREIALPSGRPPLRTIRSSQHRKIRDGAPTAKR
jgi:23S rRNA pseudouridine2605 synthase